MAQQVDGEITIGISLKADDVANVTRNVQKRVEAAMNSAAGIKNVSASFAKLEHQLASDNEKLAQMTSEMVKLGNTQVKTSAYSKLEAEAEKLEKKTDALSGKLDSIRKTKGEQSPQFQALDKQLSLLMTKYTNIDDKMIEMRKTGQAFTMGDTTQEFANMQSKVEKMQHSVDASAEKFEGLTAKAKASNSIFTKICATFSRLRSLVGGVASAIGKMYGAIRSAKASFGKFFKSSEKGFKKNLITVMKYAFGVRSVFFLWKKIRAAAGEALKGLAKSSSDADEKISSIVNSFKDLKASLGTALQPLLGLAQSILVPIINMLTEAITKLGQFLALLSGQKYIMKATKATGSYADSLDNASKSANSLTSGLDELNVLSDSSSSGSSSGTDYVTEEIDPNSTVASFTDLFKQSWENADFYEIGQILGTKLNDALINAQTNILPKINEFVMRFSSSLATGINGFVDVPELGTNIGKTIAQALNIAIDGMNNFLRKVNWTNVGKFIGDGLQGVVDKLNWSGIGQFLALKIGSIFDIAGGIAKSFSGSSLGESLATIINSAIEEFDAASAAQNISALVIDLLDVVIEFLRTTDWQALFDEVVEFVTNIDYASLATKLFEGIGVALAALASLIGGLISDACSHVHEYFSESIEEAGGNVVDGIFFGIINALANVGTWIYDNVFTPFIDGFKSAFGIHSPSTVMAEQGGFIMAGLKNGMIESITKILEVITTLKTKMTTKFTELKTEVTTIFTNLKTSVCNIFTNMWLGIKTTINTILTGVEKMANGVVRGINKVINTLNNFHLDVPWWVTELTGITSFGFNIPTVSEISIPKLAQGAVIPPNNEFLAVLGDQTSGTNIEAPLSTIQDAVALVLEPYLKELISNTNSLISSNERIANKNLTIGDKEIARASVRGQRQLGMTIRTT